MKTVEEIKHLWALPKNCGRDRKDEYILMQKKRIQEYRKCANELLRKAQRYGDAMKTAEKAISNL